MTIHHTKHHNTYVTNLNASLGKLDAALSSGDVSGIISLQGAIKFNGGGHLNHSLFWENLSSEKSAPSGALEKAIQDSFGGVDKMKADLSAKSIAVQGSGWGWLGYNPTTGTPTSLCLDFRRWSSMTVLTLYGNGRRFVRESGSRHVCQSGPAACYNWVGSIDGHRRLGARVLCGVSDGYHVCCSRLRKPAKCLTSLFA
jgi:superoxide dismutase